VLSLELVWTRWYQVSVHRADMYKRNDNIAELVTQTLPLFNVDYVSPQHSILAQSFVPGTSAETAIWSSSYFFPGWVSGVSQRDALRLVQNCGGYYYVGHVRPTRWFTLFGVPIRSQIR
jgi:hypothetical protein